MFSMRGLPAIWVLSLLNDGFQACLGVYPGASLILVDSRLGRARSGQQKSYSLHLITTRKCRSSNK